MEVPCPLILKVVFMVVVVVVSSNAVVATPEFPAMFVMGDSIVDDGNNNNLNSLAKSNFMPYGIDFNGGPSGRFCNGKTIIDFLGNFVFFNHFFTNSSCSNTFITCIIFLTQLFSQIIHGLFLNENTNLHSYYQLNLFFFSNFVGELLGLPYLPTFADSSTTGGNVLRGVNYASAAAGILDETGRNLVTYHMSILPPSNFSSWFIKFL